MKILAIDTSADDTCVAVTEGRRILSNERYSQILTHTKWGGIVPSLAKRAHQERIDLVVHRALTKAGQTAKTVDYIAATFGPGLAIALEVGLNKGKELSQKYEKKLIAVNHLEGHIYSCFAQNSQGNPNNEIVFPYLALSVSGGHTSLVLLKDHLSYEIIGETIDDAAGEALDKAAKMLGLGYPGGPIIERLAKNGDPNFHHFPRPLNNAKDLNFSYSGLKTSFLYFLKSLSDEDIKKHVYDLAGSYQQAVFDSLLFKLKHAVKKTNVTNLLLCGGVSANVELRKRTRQYAKEIGGVVLFPPYTSLYGDNAAMIGIVASYKAEKGIFVDDLSKLERDPRASLFTGSF